MSDQDADTIIILSSDVIAKITEEYFNKTMFKQKVKIVDLKPHGDSGYMFSVAFVEKASKVSHSYEDINGPYLNESDEPHVYVNNDLSSEESESSKGFNIVLNAAIENELKAQSARASNGRFVKVK